MTQRIKKICSFLSHLSIDTHLWSVSVILAAVLLCVSFFYEPNKIGYSRQSNDTAVDNRIIEYGSILGRLFMYDDMPEDEIPEEVTQVSEVVSDDVDIAIGDADKLAELEELIPEDNSIQAVGFSSVEEAIVVAGADLSEDSIQLTIETSIEDTVLDESMLVDEQSVNILDADNVDMNMICSVEELELLNKLVQVEAESEDLRGKELVANVVINRLNTGIWGDSIESVIMSAGQFDPVASGAIYVAEPSDETKAAVLLALNGEDTSDGAIYFQKSVSKKWGNKEYLFRHGAHSFYR